MDSKCNQVVGRTALDNKRHTSIRRHGGGGFGGYDLDKEVFE